MADTDEDVLRLMANIEIELAGADSAVALCALTALTLETARDIGKGEALGPIGDFGTDPADSADLLELRQIIDDEIGWPTFEAQEAGDYAERLRQLATLRAENARLREALAVCGRAGCPTVAALSGGEGEG